MYGDRVHRAVIDSGVRTSGCTVHYVDEEYDHGPTILQRSCEVLPGDDADALAARVFELECRAFPEEQIEDPFASDRFTPTSLRDLVRGTGRFLSIPVVRNPFPEPEPDVLFYALSPLDAPGLGRSAHDAVDDPTLST